MSGALQEELRPGNSSTKFSMNSVLENVVRKEHTTGEQNFVAP